MTLSLDLILDHTPNHPKPWRIRRSLEQRAMRRFRDRRVARMFGERKAREMGGRLIVLSKGTIYRADSRAQALSI